MSKPKPPPRPARTPSARRPGPPAGWRLWLPLAVAVALGVVTVVWFAGRPDGESGQPAGGVRAVGEVAPPVRLPAMLATWRRAVILHVVGIGWREARADDPRGAPRPGTLAAG